MPATPTKVFTSERPSFRASADLGRRTLVKLDASNELEACGNDDVPDGVLLEDTATGYEGAIAPWLGLQGVEYAVAAKAIAAADELYVVAGGKLSDTDPGSGTVRAVAVTAAGADGDLIAFMRR